MKNKLQKIIKHIKTMFYNLSLCVSLKKDSTNVEKNEKISKFGKIIEKIRNMKFLRILGFKDFLKYDEIVNFIKEDDSNQNFSKNQHLIFIKNERDRLWMIGSDTHIFFIFDDGVKFEILEKRPKIKNISDESFTIEEGLKYAKIKFNDTKTEIPYNLSYTGGTNYVISTFKKFNNE